MCHWISELLLSLKLLIFPDQCAISEPSFRSWVCLTCGAFVIASVVTFFLMLRTLQMSSLFSLCVGKEHVFYQLLVEFSALPYLCHCTLTSLVLCLLLASCYNCPQNPQIRILINTWQIPSFGWYCDNHHWCMPCDTCVVRVHYFLVLYKGEEMWVRNVSWYGISVRC